MKLSYKWLKEYLDVKATPEEVAHALTMSGSEVEVMPEVGSDRVMDLEITSNRPDCLSIIGLAREVSTVFDRIFACRSWRSRRINMKKGRRSNAR